MGNWRKVKSGCVMAIAVVGMSLGAVNFFEWNSQRYIEKRLAYHPEQRTTETIAEQRFLRVAFEDLQVTGYLTGLVSAIGIFTLTTLLKKQRQNIPSVLRKEGEKLISKAEKIELFNVVEEEYKS